MSQDLELPNREKPSLGAIASMVAFVFVMILIAGVFIGGTESEVPTAENRQSIDDTTSVSIETTTTTIDWEEVAAWTDGVTKANQESWYAELQRQEEARQLAEQQTKESKKASASSDRSFGPEEKTTSSTGIPDEYWYRMADCETGGNWSHYPEGQWSGGLGIYRGTWEAFGGLQYASNAGYATPAQQIAVANNIAASVGLSGWGCLSVVGYP